MALSHQKFREIVFQLLYSYDLGSPDEKVMLELMMKELAVTKKNVRLAQEKVHKIQQSLSQIDPLIASVSTSYAFERIQTVAKNILRLGIFELFFDSQTPPLPPKVAIAEALRLSRKFSSPESASFVNALLDHLYQASLGEKMNQDILEQQAQLLIESEKQALELIEQEKLKKAEDEE
jgi:transcription antitermination protein NusB